MEESWNNPNLDPPVSDQGKTVAIVAHITLLGWLVAIIMHNQNRTAYGSFYLRQTLGIYLCAIVLAIIPGFYCIVLPIIFVMLLVSFIYSLGDRMTLLPGIGQWFQDWFKGI